MGLVKKYRSGGRIGLDFFMSWQASWPFSTLEFHEDKLVFRVWPKKIVLTYDMIDSAKRIVYIPILAEGVRINHHSNDTPPYLIFWYPWFGKKKVLDSFAQKGVRVE